MVQPHAIPILSIKPEHLGAHRRSRRRLLARSQLQIQRRRQPHWLPMCRVKTVSPSCYRANPVTPCRKSAFSSPIFCLAKPDAKNTTSAKDCGRLLERIYRGEFISHLASRQMEELLLNQQVTYKIPSTIPSESRVANKTGETSDCENDAAIVYTPKGDYILCIMSCEVSIKVLP